MTLDRQQIILLRKLQRQVNALARASQLPSSTVGDEGEELLLADVVADAAVTNDALPALQDDLAGSTEDASDLQAILQANGEDLVSRFADAAVDLQLAQEQLDEAQQKLDDAFIDIGDLGTANRANAEAARAASAAAADAATAATNASQAASAAQSTADTAKTNAATANQAALDAAGLAASKGEVIRQVSAPTGSRANPANLWINTTADANGNPKNTPNLYNTTTGKWEPITDQKVIDAANAASAAASAAATAQSTADAAKSSAQTAQTAAAGAQSTADKAQQTAGTAASNAQAAIVSAAAAQSTADTAVTNARTANANALAAAGIANAKGTVYTQTAPPTTVDPFGLWIDTDDGNKPYTGVQRVKDSFTSTVLTSSASSDQFSIGSTAGPDGTPALVHSSTASHQTIYTPTSYARSVGTTVRGKVQLAAQGTNLAGLALFASGSSAGYQVLIDARRSTSSTSSMGLQIRKNAASPVSTAAFALPNSEPVAGRWYVVEAFITATSITARVFTAAGAKIGEVTLDDASVTSGGMGFYAYAGAVMDDFEVIDWVASQDQAIIAAANAAATAQNTADAAKTAASGAQSTADTAKANAATAQTAADKAQSTADTAKTNAATAQSAADSATSQALSAAGIANSKGKLIVQVSAPTGSNAVAENLWFDISNDSSGKPKNQPNRWNTSTSKWEPITDQKVVDAATAAATANTAAGNAKTAADNAATAASNAQQTANQAQSAAASAQATATGKPQILFGTDTPSGTAPYGSTWFQVDSSGTVIGQWQQTASSNTGSTWTARQLRSEVIANLDVGKLTAGTANIVDAVIQKIAAQTANIQTANIKNLFVTSGATMAQATIDALWTQVVKAYKITATMIDVGTLNGVVLTGTTVQTADSGKRAVLGGNLIRFYDENNQQSGQIEGLANGAGGGLLLLSADGTTAAGIQVGKYYLPTSGTASAYAPSFYVSDVYLDRGWNAANGRQILGDSGRQILSLTNSWAAGGGRPLRYQLYNGWVQLTGYLATTGSSTGVAVLPVGMRPAETFRWIVPNKNSAETTTVTVAANGQISAPTGSTPVFDPIMFVPVQ